MRWVLRLPVRRPIAREVDEELAFHLEMRTEALIAAGWSAAAARAEAVRQFGDLEGARAYCRRVDNRRERQRMRTEYLAELRQDVRVAVRTLMRVPAFTSIAVLTLALGIGATTAIFSVVRGILLRPLPFGQPDRLAMVVSTYRNSRFPYASPANVVDWQSRQRSFTDLVPYTTGSEVLTGAGEPEEVATATIGAELFSILRVEPVVGRVVFTPAEAAWNGPEVAILNESIWRSRFGADSGIVGKLITLDGRRVQVVGVVPARAAFPAGTVMWRPYRIDPAKLASSRAALYLSVIGRLRPDVSLASADADMATVSRGLAAEYPVANDGLGTAVVRLQQWIVGSFDRPLMILLGGVGFVLLIAAGNVANLLLARGVGRQGELAVRTALGAGRGRLTRQLVTEGLVLSFLGAAAGIALAMVGTRVLVALAPATIPRLGDIRIDPMVLAFALVLGLVTGVAFGVLPARVSARQDVAVTLRAGSRGSSAGGRGRRVLVVAEVALSVILLAGAGLLIRSFARLLAVDPGFRAESAISFGLSLPDSRYPMGERQTAFVAQVLERIRGLPGIRGADAGMDLPLTGFRFGFSFAVSGRPVSPADAPSVEVRVGTAGYFETMGIRILRGRGFGPEDRPGRPRALVVNEAAARRYFPGEDPIGKHVKFGWGREGGPLEGDIVGVAADVKQSSLAQDALPQFWAAYQQWPVASVTVVIRATRDLASVVADARRIVHELDPDLALSRIRTLDSLLADSVAQPKFYMVLVTVFALVAIVLAGIGIYGVTAYLVGSRIREIGIRIALGASWRLVMGMVVREGAVLAIVGLVIGTVGALALNRVMTALLYGVGSADPVTYGTVAIVLLAVALAASWVPARRATLVNPITAIRTEP